MTPAPVRRGHLFGTGSPVLPSTLAMLQRNTLASVPQRMTGRVFSERNDADDRPLTTAAEITPPVTASGPDLRIILSRRGRLARPQFGCSPTHAGTQEVRY